MPQEVCRETSSRVLAPALLLEMTKVTRTGSRQLLALILPALLLVSCTSLREDDDDADLLSLLDFKRAITNDPHGALSTWNASAHFCSWHGVVCSRRQTRRVVALDLAGQGLAGHLSASLGNLSHLAALNLSTNSFSGEIPHLGRLHELRSLDLSYNSLLGRIPDTLANCSRLRALNLTRNFLAGHIPTVIASLSNLSSLRLHLNNLTGIIPPELCNITSLKELGVAYNQLGGEIPQEIGRLTKLTTLALGVNMISGQIPASLFNLSSLQLAGLSVNTLGGPLPSDIGDAFPNLLYLELSGNMFQGYVPAWLGNLSTITDIDLASNQFGGTIPVSLGKLPKLEHFSVQYNNLEAKDSTDWEFLHALCNCSLLQMLGLYGNQLQGVVPSYLGNLSSSLRLITLGGDNNLSGVFPPNIGNLRNLIQITLADTSVAGTLGEWIGKLGNLQGLYIPRNNFVGTIPSSIGNLTKLSAINLQGNGFEGVIPSALGNLPQLSLLGLSHNNLRGSIPNEILRRATLTKCLISHNNLEGLIPDLSNLQQLTWLDLSSNMLSGKIPESLGTCRELQTIQMEQNFLSGSIPISLENLISLTTLNLSHNNLSGTVPAVLSHLKFLSQLDLSDNHLEGEIPSTGVFRNITGVSLNGNRGLCGGARELHMPLCPVVSQKARRSKMLVKILVPIFGILVLILMIYYSLNRKRIPKVQLSLPSTVEKFPKISYKDLEQATERFAESNLIGKGSFGLVYRGRLANMVVAVKVFHSDMREADRSYMSECEALRNIRHRNLLSILTACSTIDNKGNDFKALIYEFMTNGNLDTWLHPTGNGNVSRQLALTQRIDIVVDIADALQYLHHGCENPIIHCDLKPSNILLDDDMTAHLGDFGIARFYPKPMPTSVREPGSISSIGLKGTIGYIAPEYAEGCDISISGDVYSFGVVLLEILTGKRPTDPMFCNGLTIVDFVATSYQDNMPHILDAQLQKECDEFTSRLNMEEGNRVYWCLLSLIKVGLSCTCQIPSERMDMRETAAKLHAIRTSYRPFLAF